MKNPSWRMLAAFPSAASITEPAKWIGILFLGTAPLQITNSLAAHGAGAQIGSAPPQPAATAPPRLSSGVAEVIGLAESGVSEDAVLAYIKACPTPFDGSAEILIYLTDVGLAPAMIERDKELAGRNSRDKAPAPIMTIPRLRRTECQDRHQQALHRQTILPVGVSRDPPTGAHHSSAHHLRGRQIRGVGHSITRVHVFDT